MLRSIVRTATIVIPRYTAPARAGSSSSVSCLRVLTQSWRREAYLRLSSGRYMWVRPGTRLYSDHLTDVGIEELDCLLKEGRVQLFDVREPSELLETGKIPRSVNIPLAEVEEALKMTPDKFLLKYKCPKPSKDDTDIIFHCKKGVRSQKALQIAHQLGYSKSRHLNPGFAGWVNHWKDTHTSKVETVSK